jgi:O-antigen/teichoic acid export membrane protein
MSFNSEVGCEPVPSLSQPSAESVALSRAGLVRDSVGYFLGKVIPGFFGLISVPIFVRVIGLEEYGRLSVLLPILMALSGAGSGWLTQGILRFHPLPADSTGKKFAFRQGVLRGTIYSLVASGGVLTGILAAMRYRIGILVIAAAYCALQLAYTITLAGLQARLLPQAVLRNEALRATLGFLLPILIVLAMGKRLYPLVLLGLALGYLVPLLLETRNSSQPSSAGAMLGPTSSQDARSSETLRSLWRYGWAVGAWLMLSQLLPVVGRSAIERFAGYKAAGMYASMYEVAVRAFLFLCLSRDAGGSSANHAELEPRAVPSRPHCDA